MKQFKKLGLDPGLFLGKIVESRSTEEVGENCH
jgi:hypothetical protein